MSKPRVVCFWFRRDLRLHDNHGLYEALRSGLPVVPVFIFDRSILDPLPDPHDRRVEFIHHSLSELQEQLVALGSTLHVQYGFPGAVWEELCRQYDIEAVYTNHDYEPYAEERDQLIGNHLQEIGTGFKTFKDHVIFEKTELLSGSGGPYTVFTPYSRKWKERLQAMGLPNYPSESLAEHFHKQSPLPPPSLQEMGFEAMGQPFPTKAVRSELLQKYQELRDFPAVPGTSRLSVHLRFGTVSIREVVRLGLLHSETWLNELIWRDFYQQILANFPQVGKGRAFRPAYEHIPWRNNQREFEAWCQGRTGYPLVDAGMRELNATGFMHNRVRMVTASFLVKHLLIDWRWGEAYFAEKLLDFDLASNNGGWQWAAGTGTDAQPYFRVFNPDSQTEKFDKDLKYIKKWIPELGTNSYPKPIVDHKFARTRAIDTYKKALEQ